MQHLLRRLVGAFLILTLLLPAFLLNARPRLTTPAANASALTSADPRFGMNSILPDNYSHIPGIRPFAWASAAAQDGARLNRFSFDWQVVEPKPGSFDFSVPDAFVASDAAQGFLTIATLEHTPYWATAVATSNPAPQVPTGLSLPWNDPGNVWGAFVYAAATRYRGRIAYYEVWNEPDLLGGAGWAGSRADYFQLLKVGYQAIKAADPAAQVITGSLNYNPTWLNDVFSADTADPEAAANGYFFDAVGLHSYGRSSGLYTMGQSARAVMSHFGFTGKAVIATEMGIPVDDNPPVPATGLIGTSDEAASYLLEAFAAALAGGIDRVLVYRASDVGQTSYWGLRKASGVPRATAAAFALAARYYSGVQAATLSTSDPITRVDLDEGQQRVTVLWNNAPRPASVAVAANSAAGGTLIDQTGAATAIQPGPDGSYQLALPPATNNHGANSSDFIIGGGPLLLVEQGPFLPTATPTFSATPTFTATPIPSLTAVPTSTVGFVPFTPPPSNTPSPTATATATPSATATVTSTPTFPPQAPRLYFPEGSAAGAYAEYLNLANPGAQPARLHLTWSGQTGPISSTDTLAAAHALTTIDIGALHLPPGPIGATLLADRPVAGERSLYFGSSASVGTGAAAPSTTWYLPGLAATAPITQVVTISNPGGEATGLSLETITDGGVVRVTTSHVDPYARRSFTIAGRGQNPGLATIVTADQPVVAEYTAYLAAPAGITGAVGVRDLSRLWYSAEGYHNRTWGDHLVILNPDSHFAARITVRLFGQAGSKAAAVTASVVVPAGRRASVDLGPIAPGSAFSMVLTSSVPVALNRVETFGPGESRAALSVGIERPALTWSFPAGDTSAGQRDGHGPGAGYGEFLLLFNPTATRATLRLDVLDSTGATLRQLTYGLPPLGRLSVDMSRVGVPRGLHATIVAGTNGVRFVAEQSVYFNDGLGGYSGPGVPS